MEDNARKLVASDKGASKTGNSFRPGALDQPKEFDPYLHQQYLELPPLPPTSDVDLQGSWRLTQDVYDKAVSHPAASVLSFDYPRAALFRSFLSPSEVQHLVEISKDHLVRSEVVVEKGSESVSNARTSFGVWPESTEITRNLTNRIHRLLGIPEEFGEQLYVLNYKLGQQYQAHNDNCMAELRDRSVASPSCVEFLKRARGPRCGPGAGGPSCGDRVATFILQLSHPSKGGRTVFPSAAKTTANVNQHHLSQFGEGWYCEEESVLGVLPNTGDGVLFWDYRPGNGEGTGSYEDGTAKPQASPVFESNHAGCPVTEGEKWIVTRWIRGAQFV